MESSPFGLLDVGTQDRTGWHEEQERKTAVNLTAPANGTHAEKRGEKAPPLPDHVPVTEIGSKTVPFIRTAEANRLIVPLFVNVSVAQSILSSVTCKSMLESDSTITSFPVAFPLSAI